MDALPVASAIIESLLDRVYLNEMMKRVLSTLNKVVVRESCAQSALVVMDY